MVGARGFKPPTKLKEWNDFGTRLGLATPWLTKKVRDEVMKLDKYLLPAAYPSRLLQYRMKNSSFGFIYKLGHFKIYNHQNFLIILQILELRTIFLNGL